MGHNGYGPVATPDDYDNAMPDDAQGIAIVDAILTERKTHAWRDRAGEYQQETEPIDDAMVESAITPAAYISDHRNSFAGLARYREYLAEQVRMAGAERAEVIPPDILGRACIKCGRTYDHASCGSRKVNKPQST